MTRYIGMYRRSELIRLTGIPDTQTRRVAVIHQQQASCGSGQHQQETDANTGNETCRRCGVMIDDYADVIALGMVPQDLGPLRRNADHSKDATS